MMTNLVVKEVEFQGDSLMTALNKSNNKVYVGVSWICNGIGLKKGQKDRQVKNVQEDIVLKQGCFKFEAGVFDPNNETLAIELDFLPLWLAKISITPKMHEDSPETVERLIDYQLKAKEVLANAFVRNVTQIVPTTYKDALKSLIESIEKQEEQEEVIQEQKYEIDRMKPKENSYDHFMDGRNNKTMNDVAKSLDWGRTKLFSYLKGKGILMSDNVPYQRYINSKHFVVKQYSTMLNTGYLKNVTTTYVTPKGIDYIGKLLREDDNLKLNS